MINSRSDKHPDWVQLARDTVQKQSVDCELVEVDNIGRKKTIGECWNEGIRKSRFDYVLFLGDDDWLSADYCSVVLQYAINHPNYVMWTTYMTAFSMEENIYTALPRICTGMWSKEYLLKFPFNEELQKGIDREYIEEMQKRGDVGLTIKHHHGYYYRKHEDYSCAGKITFQQKPADIYVLTTYRNFIDPLVKEWRKDKEVFVSTEDFNTQMADEAEIIWCEWLHNRAVDVANYKCKAKKFLRIHAYEAFSNLIHYIDFSKFDKVIFIAKHIKDYVEFKVGPLPNATVIPVGIDLDKFKLTDKTRNNKIAYAGEITRKKGVGELLLIAKSLPEYEFHVAGKFKDEDVARHLNEKQPENVFIHPYSYDLNEFFRDKTYFINTSLREGNPITVLEAMACGLKPLINDWVGAVKIYGRFVFRDLFELEQLLRGDVTPDVYREFAEQYNLKRTIERINEVCFNRNGIYFEKALTGD